MATGSAIDVLYFAQVAELVGRREERWPLPESVTAGQWLAQLEARYPQLAPVGRLQLAVNQTHAGRATPLAPGDEVAVFEPVTGG